MTPRISANDWWVASSLMWATRCRRGTRTTMMTMTRIEDEEDEDRYGEPAVIREPDDDE
jgi:hypothetical protein